MQPTRKLLIPRIIISILAAQSLNAGTDILHTHTTTEPEEADRKDIIYLPYLFSSDSTGFAGGAGVIKKGLLQPETTAIATLFYGTEQDIITNSQPDTANFSGGFAAIFDYLIPGTDRLLFSVMGMKSHLPKAHYYLYDHSNNSDKESYVETSGNEDFIYASLKYVLPIGEGEDNPDGEYTLKNGFAVGRQGYGGGKPFITGRTSVGMSGFYEHHTFENYLPDSPRSSIGLQKWDTNGLRFFMEHDNTDYDLNPSRGYQFKLQYSKDFGWGDSQQSWDFMEFKYNHYINLPPLSSTQQNVFAMSLWTGYSFSWDRNSEFRPGIADHRPPPWEGARLGGMFRMRGYSTNRFSDKAVLYGTAEYRAILNWNPFKKNKYIPVTVDWLQLVGFIEAGRVNDRYNSSLFQNMKLDAGISLRTMALQVPVRIDIAYSKEGTNIWLMLFQPFDF